MFKDFEIVDRLLFSSLRFVRPFTETISSWQYYSVEDDDRCPFCIHLHFNVPLSNSGNIGQVATDPRYISRINSEIYPEFTFT